MTLPTDYFDQLYAASGDPWGFRSRWYEQRKRALVDASLLRPRYGRAFEPGCSIGTLSAVLADRCDELVASDVSAAAVRTAAEALAGRTNVDVRRLRVPEEWPDGHFDLVVLSEVGYYLSSGDLHRLVERTAASLEPGGAVLACHWRHDVADYPTTGDAVHRVIDGHPALVTAVRHEEEDFLLDVWTRGAVPSVARREGLVG